jgi:hypothetical protein
MNEIDSLLKEVQEGVTPNPVRIRSSALVEDPSQLAHVGREQ